MSRLYFCDTNVLVYAVDAVDSEKQARARHLLRTHASQLAISTQVLLEYFATCTGRLSMPVDAARRLLSELAGVRTGGSDAASVLAAAALGERLQLSIYDAMIVVAAESMRCSVLFTEDAAILSADTAIRTENPFA